ncbi:DUF6089 family protein [Ferruginibacter albus]|uniref:DUF6089 family protein n=1 Tax=Ferruginibacter albus TaxID=2875540 RepID=UPI001CC60D7C|nr:DUF6089 family protein [Ferruginibacter albus]UAY50925.1 DUF6089 family protein [Ferruginibacter albus]
MQRILVIALLVSSFNVSAQKFHLTLFGGMSNYMGDMQSKPFTFDEAHAAYGGGLLYEITDQLSARANVTIGTVSGNDRSSSSSLVRDRNLNFTSPVTEAQLGLEYDILSLYEHQLTPYVFAGVAYFSFNPYTYDSLNVKTYLQPLGTEGQGFYQGRTKYSLNQLAIPVGVGLKFAISDNVRLAIEVGYRKLFTDYIDDLSMSYADPAQLLAINGPKAYELAFRGDELHNGQTYPTGGSIRGNPKTKDWYYFSGVTLSFRLPNLSGDGGSGGGGKNTQYGCPGRPY